MNERKKSGRELPPGTELKQGFLIVKTLGAGGFGITYEAVSLRDGSRVAIKEYFCRDYMDRNSETFPEIRLRSPADSARYEKDLNRFIREGRVLSCFLGLPAIVRVLEQFQENLTAYLVMEYLDGRPLADYLNSLRNVPGADLFRLFLPICHSLQKVHELGVVHRDISPDNIMVLGDGRLCLIDFGSAISFRDEKTRTVFLKDGYAPAEQYTRRGKLGPWTDIYALSAVLYRVITGQVPDNAVQRGLYDELRSPRDMGKDLPLGLEEILMKGLAVRIEDRYRSMGELISELSSAGLS